MLCIKFQVQVLAQVVLKLNTNKRSKGVKGHNSANVLQNSFKSHLNIDPKQYSKFQDPSSSNALDIMLTMFSYSYKNQV